MKKEFYEFLNDYVTIDENSKIILNKNWKSCSKEENFFEGKTLEELEKMYNNNDSILFEIPVNINSKKSGKKESVL